MAQIEQYTTSINFAEGDPAVRSVNRMPVTVVQVVESTGGLTFAGSIGESSGGTIYTRIPCVSLLGPEVYKKDEVVPGVADGLFGLLTIGFKSIKVTGGSKGKVDLSSLNADPSFIYSRLTREDLAPYLIALAKNQDDFFAWLNEKWKLLEMIIDPENIA